MNIHTQLILSLLTGSLAAYLAHRQKRNLYLWFAIGAFLGLLGVLAFLYFPKQKKSPVLDAPTAVLQGPTDKLWYYLDEQHQQQGPMSFSALARAWKEGKAKLETYVWHEELPEWKLLKEFVK